MRILHWLLVLWFAGTALAVSSPDDELISQIRLPPGFVIQKFAEVPSARALALSPTGTTLYVSTRLDPGNVYAIPLNGCLANSTVCAVASPPIVVVQSLSLPSGIDLLGADLFVAALDRVLRFRNLALNLTASVVPENVTAPGALPNRNNHALRYARFGPDGKLYVSIGSPCNVPPLDGTSE